MSEENFKSVGRVRNGKARYQSTDTEDIPTSQLLGDIGVTNIGENKNNQVLDLKHEQSLSEKNHCRFQTWMNGSTLHQKVLSGAEKEKIMKIKEKSRKQTEVAKQMSPKKNIKVENQKKIKNVTDPQSIEIPVAQFYQSGQERKLQEKNEEFIKKIGPTVNKVDPRDKQVARAVEKLKRALTKSRDHDVSVRRSNKQSHVFNFQMLGLGPLEHVMNLNFTEDTAKVLEQLNSTVSNLTQDGSVPVSLDPKSLGMITELKDALANATGQTVGAISGAVNSVSSDGSIKVGLEQETLGVVNQLNETLSGVVGKLPDMSGGLGGIVSGTIEYAVYTALVLLLVASIRHKTIRTRETSVVLVASLLFFYMQGDVKLVSVTKDIVFKLLEAVSARYSGSFETQMGFDELDGVCKIISVYFFSTIVGSAPEGKRLDRLFASAGSFPKNAEGLASLGKSVVLIIENIVNAIRREIFNMEAVTFLEYDNAEVNKYVSEVKTIAGLVHTNKFPLTVGNSDRVHKAWLFGNELLSRYGGREHSQLRAGVQIQQNYVSKIKATFDQANIRAQGIRQVPLTVLVRGPSGVGKSVTTLPLVVSLLGELLPREDLNEFGENHEQFIYNRQHEHAYWDGYRQQMVCVFDDFGQVKDVPGNPDNEYMDLIRASNMFNNTLHMAGMDQKGVTDFKSKIVLCSTNIKEISPTSIIEPEAVKRRFDVVVDLVPSIKYCKDGTHESGDIWSRRLDVGKLKGGFDREACEFHEVKLVYSGTNCSMQPTQKIFTFDQLVEHLKERYVKHEESFTSFSSDLTNLKNEKIESRVDKFVDAKMIYDFQMGSSELDDILFEEQFMLADVEEREFMAKSYDENPKVVEFLSKVEYLEDFPEFYDVIKYSMKTISKALSQGLCHIPAAICLSMIYDNSEKVRNLLESIEMAEDFGERRRLMSTLSANLRLLSRSERAILNLSDKWYVRMADEALHYVQSGFDMVKSFLEAAMKKLSFIASKFPRFTWWVKNLTWFEWFAMITGTVILTDKFCKTCFGLADCLTFMITGKNLFSKNPKGSIGFQSFERDSRANGRRHAKHTIQRVKAKLAPQIGNYEFQLGGDPVMRQIAMSVASKNSYELVMDGEKKVGYVTFVRGRTALLPWHFVTAIAAQLDEKPHLADKLVSIRRYGESKISYDVPLRDFLEAQQATAFETLDVCLMQFNKNVPAHKDIVKYFMPHEMAVKKRDLNVCLIAPGAKVEASFAKAKFVHQKMIGVKADEMLIVRKGYEYPMFTQVGDCGSFLCLQDSTSGCAKIIGIHTAGEITSQIGFATAVSREDLLESLDLFEEVIELQEEFELQGDIQVLDGRFSEIGKIEKSLSNPQRSAIVPSLLFDDYTKAKTKQAKLKSFVKEDGEKVDPMDLGLSNYCTKDVTMNTAVLEACSQNYFDYLSRNSEVKREFRTLTFEEAVLGIPEEKNFKSIPRQTSSGYPWNLDHMPDFPGKSRFFGKDQEYDLTGVEALKLKSRCEAIIARAKMGFRDFHVFSDYLKDERRPIEKVDQGKTRIISASPLDLLIVYRQYFGSFTTFMMDNKIWNGSALGVNPYSYDWERVSSSLREKGNKFGAGDYSKFDGSEKPIVHWKILSVIERFYGKDPVDSKVREVLWEELVNSRHLKGDVLYEWVSSLPSGHPLTTIVNIMYNHIAFRYCYVMAHAYPEYGTDEQDLSDVWEIHQRMNFGIHHINSFAENVYLIALGDDNLFSVSDLKIGIFNQESISRYMKALGLTYTDEKKEGGKVVPHRRLEEVTFLKRSFRVEPILGRHVAPLDLDVILEMPMWTKRGPMKDQITDDNVHTALLELSLHKAETFNEWCPKIVNSYLNHYEKAPASTGRTTLLYESSGREYEW